MIFFSIHFLFFFFHFCFCSKIHPAYNKKIVDDLTPSNNGGVVLPPYKDIGLYILLVFIQGGNVGSTGFLNSLRSCLWVKITQFTDRAIRLKMFNHIHK